MGFNSGLKGLNINDVEKLQTDLDRLGD